MHVAVCDDNVADRKQLERLLGRQADARKSSGNVLYTDSFGDSRILLRAPMQYQLFLLDETEGLSGLDIALQLIEHGIVAPIVLCSGKLDYEKLLSALPEKPQNISVISKPISVSTLSDILDAASLSVSRQVPLIELRGETDTYYVKEDDIICGIMTGKYFLKIFLTDERTILLHTDLINFYNQICIFTHFCITSKETFINITFLEHASLLKLTLKNCTEECRELKISPACRPDLNYVQKLYAAELHSDSARPVSE